MSQENPATPPPSEGLSTRSEHELANRQPRPLIQAAPPQDRSDPYLAEGKLAPHEFAFRLGLLIGSLLFFHESVGAFVNRGLLGLAGFLLSILIVLTLAMKWRVLGDWRQRFNLILYAVLIVVLSYPTSAVLSPTLGVTALPEMIERPLAQFLAQARAVPGMSNLLDFIRGMISFLFLLLTLIILVLGSVDSRRGGLLVVSIFLTAICLFFNPVVETAVGFILLGTFFFNQWEIPLLVAPKIRRHLKPVQVEFLRELVRQGWLSTGETKIYLDNDPALFSELLDLRLVDYDSVSRDILPGHRLLHDPAAETLEAGFSFFRRCIWIAIGLLYFVLPDPIFGPIDDLIVLAITTGAGTRFFQFFRPRLPDRRVRRSDN